LAGREVAIRLLLSGGAAAKAVSRLLPTVAARVRSQVWSRRICGVLVDTETVFHLVLQLSLTILIPPTVPHSSGCYNSGQRTKWTRPNPQVQLSL
jgi:hypothetical protein